MVTESKTEQEDRPMNIKEATRKMKQDSFRMAALSGEQRNAALEAVRIALLANREAIFKANHEDMEAAEKAGIAAAVMKRLKFDEHKLQDCLLYTSTSERIR